MLHEKPNEAFHWKNKLDEIDRLPDEAGFDKSASWQKLHDRLRSVPAKKGISWYWVAAAVLLAIAFIPLIVSKQKSQPVIVRKPESQQQLSSPEALSKVVPFIDTLVKKETIARSVNKKIPKVVDHTKIDQIFPVKISPDTSGRPSPQIIVQAPEYPDTVSSVFVAPVKKKLKVVHINELGQPASEQVQYAKGFSSPLFQVGDESMDQGIHITNTFQIFDPGEFNLHFISLTKIENKPALRIAW